MKRLLFWLMVVILIISAMLLLYGSTKLFITMLSGAVNYKYLWYMFAFISLIISLGIIESMIRPMD